MTGYKIQRTDNYQTHTEVGKVAETRINYIVKCKKCGQVFKYQKKTNFVKSVIDGDGYSSRYRCRCGSHNFELVETEK